MQCVNNRFLTVLYCLAIVLIAGCGNKGPLYLPESDTAKTTRDEADAKTDGPVEATPEETKATSDRTEPAE